MRGLPRTCGAVCIAAFLCHASAQLSCPDSISPGATCVIANVTLFLNTAAGLSINGSLLFQNVTITHSSCASTGCSDGNLMFNAGGNITVLNGSSIQAPSLSIISSQGSIFIDSTSTLRADGMGPEATSVTGADGVDGTGGGHGGAGAVITQCNRNAPQPASTGGAAFGANNLAAPYFFGGASAGYGSIPVPVARGGGRVWIQANVSILVDGAIIVDGASAPTRPICRCGAGGGAGGSIYLAAPLVNVWDGMLSAVGGSSQDSGGGGGGIISLDAAYVIGAGPSVYNVSGGVTLDRLGCPIASPGIAYVSQSAGDFPFQPDTSDAIVERVDRSQELAREMARCEQYFARLQDVWQAAHGASLRQDDDTDITHVMHLNSTSAFHTVSAGGALDASLCARMFPWLTTDGPSATVNCISQSITQRSSAPLMQTAIFMLSAAVTDVVMNNCAWIFGVDFSQLSLNSLSISGGDFVTQHQAMVVEAEDAISLQGTSRMYTATTNTFIVLSAQSLRLTRSLISAGTVESDCDDTYVGTQAFVHFAWHATFVSGVVTIINSVSQTDLPAGITTLNITAGNVTIMSEALVQAGNVFLVASDLLTLGGLVSATQTFNDPSVCPFAGQPAGSDTPAVLWEPCVPGSASDSAGFTGWVTAYNLFLQRSGSLQASAVRVCASTLEIQQGGSISAAGLGCGGGYGPGAGVCITDEVCSGGGHGNVGGNGVDDDFVAAGGDAYDNSSAPCQLGSGGGSSINGGAGGGIVWVDTEQLDLGGIIAANGLPGQSGDVGGGGGSGGSLVLVAYNLTGVGSINMGGGDCAVTGCGGGGGGVINVQWLSSTAAAMRAEAWYAARVVAHARPRRYAEQVREDALARASTRGTVRGTPGDELGAEWWLLDGGMTARDDGDFQGNLANGGGLGVAPGLNGGHGTSQSSPTCAPGQGGALCLPCAPGAAKNHSGDNTPCLLCPAGTYSNTSGSTDCTPCNGTSVAPFYGSTECVPCDAGYSPNANATACSLCAPGYAGPPCSLCPAGTVSTYPYTACIPCPGGTFAYEDMCMGCPAGTSAQPSSPMCFSCAPGTWSAENASECSACPAKPAHSSWVAPPILTYADRPSATCQFVCDAGYLQYPLCISPWQDAYDAIGGYVTFTIVSSLLGASVFVAACGFTGPSARKFMRCTPCCASAATKLQAKQAAARDADHKEELQHWLPPHAADLPLDYGIHEYWDIVHEIDSEARISADACCAWLRGGAARLGDRSGAPERVGASENARTASRARSPMPRVRVRSDGSNGVLRSRARTRDASDGTDEDVDGPRREEHVGSISVNGMRSAMRMLRGSFGTMSVRSDDDVAAGVSDASIGNVQRGRNASRLDEYAPSSTVLRMADRLNARTPSFSQHVSARAHSGSGPDAMALDLNVTTSSSSGRLHAAYARTSDSDAQVRAAVPVDCLDRHVHRVFFAGTNTAADPLRLAPRIPPELAAVLSEQEWAEHAQECTELAMWRPWEATFSSFLRTCFLPLALLFEERVRAARVRTLAVRHAEHNHAFLRNTRAQALGNCVYFGASPDYTLAYLDILVASTSEDTAGAPIGAPRLPACVVMSGDGSYFTPYRIDASDSLTASMLALICPDYMPVVAAINDVLREIRGPSLTPCVRVREDTHRMRTLEPSLMHMDSSDALLMGGSDDPLTPPPSALSRTPGKHHAASSSFFSRALVLDEDWVSTSKAPLLMEEGTPTSPMEAGDSRASATVLAASAHVAAPAMLERQPALKVVQDLLSVVNDALQARTRAAREASARYAAAYTRYTTAMTAGADGAPGMTRRASNMTSVTGTSSSASSGKPASGAGTPGVAMRAGAQPAALATGLDTSGVLPTPPMPLARGVSLHSGSAALQRVVDNVSAHSVLARASSSTQPAQTLQPPLARAPGEDELAALREEVEEAEEGLVHALRMMPLGYPDAEVTLILGRTEMTLRGANGAAAASEDGRLCLLLLPRSAPPPGSDGTWPFYLPYSARPLVASAAASLGLLRLASPPRPSVPSTSTPLSTGAASDTPSRASVVRSSRRMLPGAALERAASAALPPAASHQLWHSIASVLHAFTTSAASHIMVLVPALLNLRTVVSWRISCAALLLVLLVDACLTMLALSGLFTLTPAVAGLAVLLPPFVLPAAPFYGLLALARSSPRALRLHAALTLLCVLPVCVTIVGGAFCVSMGTTDIYVGVLVPVVLLAAKWLVLRLTHMYVAILDVSDSLRMHETAAAAVAYAREVYASVEDDVAHADAPVLMETNDEPQAPARSAVSAPRR